MDETVRKEVGARIKKRRKELKMTQKELAQKIMKKEITVRQYESGARFPDLMTQAFLSNALDCKPSDLFGHEIHIGSGALPPEELREWFKKKGVKLPDSNNQQTQPSENKPNETSPQPAVDVSGLTDREIHELQIYRDFLIFRRGQSAETSPDNNPDT